MSDESPQPEFQEHGFAGPKGPPGEPTTAAVEVPEAFSGVKDFLVGIVADEALLLDIAYSRAVDIVEHQLSARRAGIDNFIEQGIPPVVVSAQMATPLAVELYKQALASLGQPDNAARFKELVDEARKKTSGAGILMATGR